MTDGDRLRRSAYLSSFAYRIFEREEWAALRANTPLTLSAADLATLRGRGNNLSLDEVEDIFLPLSRLLNLYVRAARGLDAVQNEFLGRPVTGSPYIIGLAGSVAVGKSTFARVLQAILSQWPDHPRVTLVTTDGFLYPRAKLIEMNLLSRKGFPESYDKRAMIEFLLAIKAGEPLVRAPCYSHLAYDIIPGQVQTIKRPDILIFEGLNVLQHGTVPNVLASDFFDFSIYLDAEERDLERWYIQRFLLLQKTAFQEEGSYFHGYRNLPHDETVALAHRFWAEINLPNLHRNIEPTRERARLVLHKGEDHRIDHIALRGV